MDKKNNSNYPEKNMAKLFVAVTIVVIAILLVVSIIMLGITVDNDVPEDSKNSGSAQSDAPVSGITLPELKIDSIEEQGDQTVISTSYCTFKYPTAYSDLINVEAYNVEGMSGIKFTATIKGEKVPIYSLLFNSAEGGDFGTVKIDGVSEPVRVSVVFFELPQGMDGDDKATFFATQETVNDILSSLNDFEGFEPAY